MFSRSNLSKLVVIGFVLCGLITVIKATYYQDALFPIGLTGLDHTGGSASNTCPYGAEGWTWDDPSTDKREDNLIFDLGVNCIGSQDAWPKYLMELNPDSTAYSWWLKKYLYKVCMESGSPGSDGAVYLIMANYYAQKKWYEFPESLDTLSQYKENHCCQGFDCGWHYSNNCITPDSCMDSTTSKSNEKPSQFFRSPHRPSQPGWGSMLFAPYGSNGWYDHGTHTNNWQTFDGDSLWRLMADDAVNSFGVYFDSFPNHADYIWGYNLITEDGGIYRHTSFMPCWEGQWAAVDRIFTGHKDTLSGHAASPFPDTFGGTVPHAGIRGKENSLSAFSDGHHMIVAKGGTWPLHREGFNIFQWLPDIDVFISYQETKFEAKYNYGEQVMFDNILYDDSAKIRAIRRDPARTGQYEKSGHHYTAIYFQQYAGDNLAYPDQKRRWIPTIGVKWSGLSSDGSKAWSRRPCPPEIRCAVYLCLSRGAKGIFFHPWLKGYSDSSIDNIPASVTIPCSIDTGGSYVIGMRDCDGYPFGHPDEQETHYLNNGTGSTYWHEDANRKDITYTYLKDDLIPELKKITPKLMQLDWVNAYSLNSTMPNWRSPCPHYYMEDVWGVDYMDVAFFDHPYEPVGVEYFMMVNREGIADMTNRNVGVALDAGHWPESDTLILTDMANRDKPRKLKRVGERFTFTEVFEPGEGKLYRVAPLSLDNFNKDMTLEYGNHQSLDKISKRRIFKVRIECL